MYLNLWQPALRSRLSPILLLATALLLANCSEPQTFLKPGPLFAAAEEVPSNQGQVYFYWPAEERGRWGNLMVGPCEESIAWVQPGGYTRLLVPPGRQCFQMDGGWQMESINTSASLDLDRLDLDVAAGQTLFVRVENGHGLFSGMSLRAVEPAKAKPEIQRCGEMIPLSEEEMRQALRARTVG
jgi:hypothetical protein